MKRTHNTRIIDFQKELEIARISQILRTSAPFHYTQALRESVQQRFRPYKPYQLPWICIPLA